MTESVSILYLRTAFAHRWFGTSMWFCARASDAHNRDYANALIDGAARYEFSTLILPLSPLQDDDFPRWFIENARNRGLRTVVQIHDELHNQLGTEQITELVRAWCAAGAIGVDLGGVEDLRTSMETYADAISATEACGALPLFCAKFPSFPSLDGEHFGKNTPVIRVEYTGEPFTPENTGDILSRHFEPYADLGFVPSSAITNEALTRATGRLNESAVLMTFLALPGIVNFEHGVLERSPSTRHTVRIRRSEQLAEGSLAIDESRANRGIISLFNSGIEVRMNFGYDDHEVPMDRVVTSSRIVLDNSADPDSLILPPGEAAWLRV